MAKVPAAELLPEAPPRFVKIWTSKDFGDQYEVYTDMAVLVHDFGTQSNEQYCIVGPRVPPEQMTMIVTRYIENQRMAADITERIHRDILRSLLGNERSAD